MQAHWDPELQSLNPSIQWLELYALNATLLAWDYQFANNRIIVICDNQSVVAMINNTSSSCDHCMKLIKKVVLFSLVHNMCIFAQFVDTKSNGIANSLSCFQNERFQALTKDINMNKQMTPVPNEIWFQCGSLFYFR